MPDYHPVEWTEERIARFWDFFAQNSAANPVCFSQDHALALFRLARPYLRRESPILDLGCGPGFFLELLAQQGYDVGGLDPSPDAIRAAKERLAPYSHTLGLTVGRLDQLPFPDHSAGTIFLIEVLEHLGDEMLTPCWHEIRRVLMPDGVMIITVPNAENLASRLVACPECGCIFHRVQHLRSFNAMSLRFMIEREGFRALRVEPLNLVHYGGQGFAYLFGFLQRGMARLLHRPRANLLAISQRLR